MEANGLPLYSGPINHLRHGFRSLETDLSAKHPIQSMQKANNSGWVSKLDTVRKIYGSHLAMQLATERETFSRMRRLPGLESSNIALQTMMGTDESIDFCDFLNGEKHNIVRIIDVFNVITLFHLQIPLQDRKYQDFKCIHKWR